MVEVLESPLIESRVTFIKGTIMDEEALIRAGAKSAVAAFVFSDGSVNACILRLRRIGFWAASLPELYLPAHHKHP